MKKMIRFLTLAFMAAALNLNAGVGPEMFDGLIPDGKTKAIATIGTGLVTGGITYGVVSKCAKGKKSSRSKLKIAIPVAVVGASAAFVMLSMPEIMIISALANRR